MLRSEQVKQLDGIVQEMVNAGEPEENIDFVVSDFKRLYDKPAPTPPKTGFAEDVKGDLASRQQDFGESIDLYKQGKQNIGDVGVQLLGGAAGFIGDVAYQGAKSVVKGTAKALGVDEAAKNVGYAILDTPLGKKGAEILQKGGAMWEDFKKKNPQIARDVEAVVNVSGLIPAAKTAESVATGAGKVAAKIGAKTAARQAESSIDDVLKVTAPVLNKRESISAIERAGKPGGVQQSGILRTTKYTPSNRDLEIAKDATGLVSSKQGFVDNAVKLNEEIERISEQEVRPFLRSRPRIFNNNILNAKLRNVEIPDFVKTDKTLENTYKLVQQRMMDAAAGRPHNMEGLWDARKDFDQIVERQFGPAVFEGSEKSTVIKQAVRDMRDAVNDFIGEQTGDKVYQAKMRRMTNLYEARGNIAERNYKLLNSNAVKRWAKQHPEAARALLYGGAGTAASAVAYNELKQILGQ